MKKLSLFVSIAAVVVLLLCIYSFLLGNEVFKGSFTNDGIAWYFLAKGIFCSLALYLLVRILEALENTRSTAGGEK
jgi:formate-dependent nitrite reductase membrane component NrfD